MRRSAGVVALAAVALAGCSRSAAPPPSPAAAVPAAPASPAAMPLAKLSKQEGDVLMQAIFAQRYQADKGYAVAEIDVKDAPASATGFYQMTLLSAQPLADGRMAVIINGCPADEQGNSAASHASAGMLNVYVLQPDGQSWKVVERRENAASFGSSGMIGSARWVMLAANKPGFIISTGGTWQGYTISVAEIFDLDGVLALGAISEMSSSAGACAPEMADACWDVSGELRFVDSPTPSPYRDVAVDFIDKRFIVTEGQGGNFVEHLKSSTRKAARYHFNGKEYVLVFGENPVPGI